MNRVELWPWWQRAVDLFRDGVNEMDWVGGWEDHVDLGRFLLKVLDWFVVVNPS